MIEGNLVLYFGNLFPSGFFKLEMKLKGLLTPLFY